jgi:hypothetical protein
MASVLRRTLVLSVQKAALIYNFNSFMKLFLFIIFFCSAIKSYSQENQVNKIDSVVAGINKAQYQIQIDSSVQSSTYTGVFFMKTYRIAHLMSAQLYKYENKVTAYTQQQTVESKMNSNTVFYFLNNRLIKVEEYMDENGKKQNAHWYYEGDRLIHYTFKSDKSEERGSFLLELSKTFVAQYIK